MNKKLIVTIILSVCFFNIFCQKCPPAFDRGTVLNTIDNSSNNLCFKWEPVPESDLNVYHTKYIITSDIGKEMYNIHFYFYQNLDSIVLVYLNTTTGKTATKSISFEKHNSVRMIKDYKFNDAAIDENTKFCTLFTIPDISRPYIVLNQFQLIDEKNIYLSLAPINTEKLQQHLKEVEIYNKWKDSVDIVIAKENARIVLRKKEMEAFLNNMKQYKDVEIKKIVDDDNEFKINGPAIEVSPGSLNDFKIKLDPLFIDYFKNIFSFQDFNSEIKFTFICQADGIIDNSKTNIQYINSQRIQWFEDSFKVNVAHAIETAVYKSLTTSRYNLDLITDFNNRYNELFDNLKPDNNEFKEFLEAKRSLYREFEKYLTREINAPTKYTYTIKYRSTVEVADWIYEITRKGVEKIGPKVSALPIPENLITIFKNKIAKPDVGKYRIKICNVYINDKLVGQDIQSF